MSRRIACIINNNSYNERVFARLKTPEAPINRLISVLRDPARGNFRSIDIVVNQSAYEARQHIRNLFNWKKRQDLLLLYFLGHIIQNEAGQLYFATIDTTLEALEETSIPAAYLTKRMDHSFSQQQLLILDCYHIKLCFQDAGNVVGTPMGIYAAFKGKEDGRVVLTASNVVQYMFSRPDNVLGQAEKSVFTRHLIRGLRTGAADSNQDGQINISELYDYVYNQVARRTVSPKPAKWSYNSGSDQLIIAGNPDRGKLEHSIKWDLIFGAIMASLITIVIGSWDSLSTSIGMAGLLLLIYAWLYWLLD